MKRACSLLACLVLSSAALPGCTCSSSKVPPPASTEGSHVEARAFLAGAWKGQDVEGMQPGAGKLLGAFVQAMEVEFRPEGKVVVTLGKDRGKEHVQESDYEVLAADDKTIRVRTVQKGKPVVQILERVDANTVRMQREGEAPVATLKRVEPR